MSVCVCVCAIKCNIKQQFSVQKCTFPQGYDVPAGHYLMLSPFWSHRDREKFPNPESFDPVSEGVGEGGSAWV